METEPEMRVIAGSAKSLPLRTPPGMSTRPTTDRIKETLFNMLQPYLEDCRFLDLCSGSGAIGIEALSRGASSCVFVDKSRAAVRCIEENLLFTKLNRQARIIPSDVLRALCILEGEGGVFDCIFADPPYGRGTEREILEYLSSSGLVDENTLIVVEADLHTSFAYVEQYGFQIRKYKKYKTNAHVFIERKV